MEVLIIIIMALILLTVLQVNISRLLILLIALMGGMFCVMILFFLHHLLRLPFTKKVKGTFTRLDTIGDRGFRTAYYLIDGQEFPCSFPAEFAMEERLYHTGKEVTLFLRKKTGKVYDVYAMTSTILGFFLSIPAALVAFRIAFY